MTTKFNLRVSENDKVIHESVIVSNAETQRAVQAFNTRIMNKAFRIYQNATRVEITVIYE